jgi:hypothetical protein
MICSAQEESPQGRKFIEDESCKKILYCKIEKINLKDAGKDIKLLKILLLHKKTLLPQQGLQRKTMNF